MVTNSKRFRINLFCLDVRLHFPGCIPEKDQKYASLLLRREKADKDMTQRPEPAEKPLFSFIHQSR